MNKPKDTARSAEKRRSRARFKMFMIFLCLVCPVVLGVAGFTVITVEGEPILCRSLRKLGIQLCGATSSGPIPEENRELTEEEKKKIKEIIDSQDAKLKEEVTKIADLGTELKKDKFDRKKILAEILRISNKLSDIDYKLSREVKVHEKLFPDAVKKVNDAAKSSVFRLEDVAVIFVKHLGESLNDPIKQINELKEALTRTPFDKKKANEKYDVLSKVVDDVISLLAELKREYIGISDCKSLSVEVDGEYSDGVLTKPGALGKAEEERKKLDGIKKEIDNKN